MNYPMQIKNLSTKDQLFIQLNDAINWQKENWNEKRASEILALKAKIFDTIYPAPNVYIKAIYTGTQNKYRSMEDTSPKIENTTKQVSGTLSFRGEPFTKLSLTELKYQKTNLERKQRKEFCHKRQFIIDKMKNRIKDSF